MNLIYSCIFYKDSYINLLEILLKSYVLFGGPKDNTKYLVICDKDYEERIQKIFLNLGVDGTTWSLNLEKKTLFESAYARLKIFDYPNIDDFEKILYLDCDILITNDVSPIFELKLENYLYALKDGHTSETEPRFGGPPDWWGAQFFTEQDNPRVAGFSSGVLLFNNCSEMIHLFEQILNHIYEYEKQGGTTFFGEQPFIVYHAIKNKMYDNTTLIGKVFNNHNELIFNGEAITHFPGGANGGYGEYECKVKKMNRYLDYFFNLNNQEYYIIHKKYVWEQSILSFLPNQMIDFGNGISFGLYRFIGDRLIRAEFGGRIHLIKFSKDFTCFKSIRQDDLQLVQGYLI